MKFLINPQLFPDGTLSLVISSSHLDAPSFFMRNAVAYPPAILLCEEDGRYDQIKEAPCSHSRPILPYSLSPQAFRTLPPSPSPFYLSEV